METRLNLVERVTQNLSKDFLGDVLAELEYIVHNYALITRN